MPVHSVLLMPTREAAAGYPKGDIRLAFCGQCGFMVNTAYDAVLQDYSPAYEESQSYSPRFREFDRDLAEDLAARHALRGKDILEIGCGKGDFLNLLCALGGNRGVGFDPAYAAGRVWRSAAEGVRFVPDVFSERYAGLGADLVCCRMTLEHIRKPAVLLDTLRRCFSDQDPVFFFQVPDATRILREKAFWDVYYEHCSYFSPGALARLFRSRGFSVTDLRRGFEGQYLLLEARLGPSGEVSPFGLEEGVPDLWRAGSRFSEGCRETILVWEDRLAELGKQGRRAVLWGGGSKAVAFLTAVGASSTIEYVVDINPHRQGTFIAGAGQEIVGPAFLRGYRPHGVIVMNPVYRHEIGEELERLGLSPELWTL